MSLTKEQLAERVAELRKLTPEQRADRREAQIAPKRAEHAAAVAEAELVKQAAEEEYGLGHVQLLAADESLEGAIVLRMPSDPEWRAARSVFRSEKAKEAAKTDAEERLIRQCLVYPDVEVWVETVRRCPTWHNPAAKACVTMGELTERETEGK